MKSLVTCIALLVAFATSYAKDLSFLIEKPTKSFPQADPPKGTRYANYARFEGDGNCMWVAIDTALAAGDWKYQINKYCKGGTCASQANHYLGQAGIPTIYKQENSGKNLTLLQKACEEGCVCVV